jgi:hypothetical protein
MGEPHFTSLQPQAKCFRCGRLCLGYEVDLQDLSDEALAQINLYRTDVVEKIRADRAAELLRELEGQSCPQTRLAMVKAAFKKQWTEGTYYGAEQAAAVEAKT